MSSLRFEHKSKIQILPGLAIFVEISLFLLYLPLIINNFLDYQEGTLTLLKTYLITVFALLMWGLVKVIVALKLGTTIQRVY